MYSFASYREQLLFNSLYTHSECVIEPSNIILQHISFLYVCSSNVSITLPLTDVNTDTHSHERCAASFVASWGKIWHNSAGIPSVMWSESIEHSLRERPLNLDSCLWYDSVSYCCDALVNLLYLGHTFFTSIFNAVLSWVGIFFWLKVSVDRVNLFALGVFFWRRNVNEGGRCQVKASCVSALASHSCDTGAGVVFTLWTRVRVCLCVSSWQRRVLETPAVARLCVDFGRCGWSGSKKIIWQFQSRVSPQIWWSHDYLCSQLPWIQTSPHLTNLTRCLLWFYSESYDQMLWFISTMLSSPVAQPTTPFCWVHTRFICVAIWAFAWTQLLDVAVYFRTNQLAPAHPAFVPQMNYNSSV